MRNNQRRSRARRKDYISELEEKVRKYESSSDQTVINPKFQQLMKENELLKRLLHSVGLGTDFLKAYTKASEVALEISQPAVRPDGNGCCQNALGKECSSADIVQVCGCATMQNCCHSNLRKDNVIPYTTVEPQPQSPFAGSIESLNTDVRTQTMFPLQQNPLQTEHVPPWEFSFDFSSFPHDTSESVLSHAELYSSQSAIHSAEDGLIAEVPVNSASSENTTLCSLAFSLIMNNNRKGYDVAELDLRLRAGYRYEEASSEGCRVENKILFSVLAEIL